jgi:hypothetical protein
MRSNSEVRLMAGGSPGPRGSYNDCLLAGLCQHPAGQSHGRDAARCHRGRKCKLPHVQGGGDQRGQLHFLAFTVLNPGSA